MIENSTHFDTPVIGPEMGIEAQWVDYNGHMNMAYYNVLLDRTGDFACDILNLGDAYRETTNRSLFTAEAHVTYIRELKPDARVRGTFRLIDADRKRMHIYYELYHVEGWLAAASENMLLHVDLGGPNVVPFPDEIHENVQTMLRYHKSLPRPKYIGRLIGIRR